MDLEREARGPESELGHGTGWRSCNARIKMRVFPKIIQASCTQVGQRENPEVVPNFSLYIAKLQARRLAEQCEPFHYRPDFAALCCNVLDDTFGSGTKTANTPQDAHSSSMHRRLYWFWCLGWIWPGHLVDNSFLYQKILPLRACLSSCRRWGFMQWKSVCSVHHMSSLVQHGKSMCSSNIYVNMMLAKSRELWCFWWCGGTTTWNPGLPQRHRCWWDHLGLWACRLGSTKVGSTKAPVRETVLGFRTMSLDGVRISTYGIDLGKGYAHYTFEALHPWTQPTNSEQSRSHPTPQSYVHIYDNR